MMRTEVMTVTPDIAEAWLERLSPRQRRPNRRHVQNLAIEMSGDKWRLTGEAIKFDTNGDLVDGQQRLAACVVSGVKFETLVAHDVPADSFDVMDQGRTRFARDLYRGSDATTVEGVARIMMLRERHGVYHAATFGGGNQHRGPNWLLTVHDLLRYMEDHEDEIHWGIGKADEVRGIFPLRKVYAALVIEMAVAKGEVAAEVFTEQLAAGEGLRKGNPVYALRDRLIRWATSASRGHPRQPAEVYAAALIRTWSAFSGDGQLKTVSGHVRPGARFPQITRAKRLSLRLRAARGNLGSIPKLSIPGEIEVLGSAH